jgi:2-oxo-4-hydroxy-4-carboxy-5-ureidoimidazoline decarboxylase
MHVHLETGDAGLDAFNDLPADAAEARLLECLAAPRWARTLVAGRPYRTRPALLDAAGAAGRDLTDDEVDDALARHPRIGERPAPAQEGQEGEEGRGSQGGREAGWSRSEQGGVDADDAVLAMALRAGNRDYERKFGRVFLIRAAGRSGPEILEALNARLLHDYSQELAVVRRELTGIAVLRLERVLAGE